MTHPHTPEVEWSRLKAHELRTHAADDAVVVIPTASIEQHGPHLPVMVDMRIGHEVAVRAACMAYEKRSAVVLPVMWMGLAEHHMDFGGTLTLDHQTYAAVLSCLVDSVLRHGFRHILLSNSHGGNALANQTTAERLAQDTGAVIVATSYATEGRAAIAEILEDQTGVIHACEAETSMMLALEPDLVDDGDLASLATPRRDGFLGAGTASFRWRPFQHVTENGVSGNPTRATAEKGERLLEAAAEAVAAVIVDEAAWGASRDLRAKAVGGVPFRSQ